VPVLVVPAKAPGAPGVQPTLDVTRILAATDFSDASHAAVQYAAALARQLSATLILAHVVEPLTVPQQWRSLVDEPDEIRVANARDRLNALAAQDCGPKPCEVIVSVGRAADVIDAIAEDCRAQLIVMGLNSDQGPFSPRPGSIAYRVLASSTIPVLVVPGR
jgi:nucleotide-binding universal stress UspA family protein